MLNLPILKTKSQLKKWRNQQQGQINFVPTMGSLHKGHKQLIEVAQTISGKESDAVLVSIFVNPLQFGPNEDFEKYPREIEKDCQIALDSGANAIWAPQLEDIFPGGINSHFKLKAPINLTSHLCGAMRAKHFDGVATVVIRLLNLVKPNTLILGEKDWQQLIILKKLIKDLNLNLKVKSVPTIRDNDGLAISSRNKYLSQAEREKALNLPSKLSTVAKNFFDGKNIDLKTIKTSLAANDLTVEYLEIVNPENLQLIENPSKLCLLAAAVHIGSTRLIDHKFLMNRYPIVAIDGPAGAGKSTVTKIFAKKMGLTYLDTGAMYRAVTWLIQEKNIDPQDEKKVGMTLKDLNLHLEISNSGNQKVFVNNQEVSHEIRSPEVTKNVSVIASQIGVREIMTAQQKQIGKKGGIVAEGRDIGSTVFPDAELKIFLTATTKERARRRAIDLKNHGFHVPELLELEEQIQERDRLDSTREISPLVKPIDAEELVTDGMHIEEVVETIIEIFRNKIAEEVWPSPIN